MKTAYLAVLTVIFIFSAFSAEQKPLNGISNNTRANIFSEITYQRVYHDNMWWIVVYQDGVKINEYPDIDAL